MTDKVDKRFSLLLCLRGIIEQSHERRVFDSRALISDIAEILVVSVAEISHRHRLEIHYIVHIIR